MKNSKNRKLILLLAAVAVLAVAVGGTIAYLVDRTNPLVNTFTPADVGVDITDKVENGVKSNVVIKNTGTTDAYIRARIVGNWVSDDDATIVQAWDPDGDGTFVGLTGTGWVKRSDGYYYYTSSVAPNGELKDATALFTSYTVTKTVEGAHLVLDIMVQAIQSEGGAAKNAWGVDPSTLASGN